MAIHAPGPHLLSSSLSRRRPRRRWVGRSGLPVLPLVDLMLVLVMFFLPQFQASGEVTCLCGRPHLPFAEHTSDLSRAPVITIQNGEVTLDVGGSGLREDMAGLTADLQTLARNWSMIHPDQPMRGSWILAADRSTDFRLVREVFAACAEAGFTDGQLLVARTVNPFTWPAP